MLGVNESIVVGKIEKDAVIKESDKGKKSAWFIVKASEKYKDKVFDDYIPVISYSQSQFPMIKAGALVYVSGKLKIKNKKNEEGKVISKNCHILAHKVEFLSDSQAADFNQEPDSNDFPF